MFINKIHTAIYLYPDNTYIINGVLTEDLNNFTRLSFKKDKYTLFVDGNIIYTCNNISKKRNKHFLKKISLDPSLTLTKSTKPYKNGKN